MYGHLSKKNLASAIRYSLAIIFLLSSIAASAQLNIKGRISDKSGNPLMYAVISLKNGTVTANSILADSLGNYSISNIKQGNCKLIVKYVSHKDTTINLTVYKDTVLNIYLEPQSGLSDVQVSTKKPMIETKMEGIRFNVGNTDLVFGNNIWDVLSKTPLVSATDDGALAISGTPGVVVYVNNKRKILSGQALKAYLSSIPADNLDAIEVLTTPSSKYDAEGNGVINIVTKKNKADGFDGTLVLSDRQTYANSQSGSVFLNGRTGKWDIYSDLYLVNRRRRPTSSQDTYFPLNVLYDSILERHIQSNDNRSNTLSSGANLGIDYQINKNNIVGLLLDYQSNWNQEYRNANTFEKYLYSDSSTISQNTDHLNSQTYSLNLNYEGKLDTLGKKISFDFDALRYNSTNNSLSKTTALDMETGNELYIQDWFKSSSPQQVNNQSLKGDLQLPLNKNSELDFGAKISLSEINNNLEFYNTSDGQVWEKDLGISNLFKYNENINSVYAIFNQKLSKKWAYQLGVRAENTIAKGYLNGEKVVDRNYTNFFPTSYLQYTDKKKEKYILSFSSRITRPSFWDVNPFRTYTTDKAYFEGNPFLLPSKYYREQLSHSINRKSGNYTFQIAASQTLNEFYSLPFADSGNIMVNKRVNYGNKYGYSGTIIYYKQLKPWWQFTGTILGGYVLSRGKYADSIGINNNSVLLSINTNQSFTISKKLGITCMVVANNTFPVTIVNTHVGDRLDTEIRLRKSAGAFNITLTADDIFKSNKDMYRVKINDLRMLENFYYDTRSVALAVSYNFGKATVKKNRERDTQFEEVKGRIK